MDFPLMITFKVKSKTRFLTEGLIHEVTVHEDGSMACSCEAFMFTPGDEKERLNANDQTTPRCWHCKWVADEWQHACINYQFHLQKYEVERKEKAKAAWLKAKERKELEKEIA